MHTGGAFIFRTCEENITGKISGTRTKQAVRSKKTPGQGAREFAEKRQYQCASLVSKTGKILVMTVNRTKGMMKILSAPIKPSFVVSQSCGMIGRW